MLIRRALFLNEPLSLVQGISPSQPLPGYCDRWMTGAISTVKRAFLYRANPQDLNHQYQCQIPSDRLPGGQPSLSLSFALLCPKFHFDLTLLPSPPKCVILFHYIWNVIRQLPFFFYQFPITGSASRAGLIVSGGKRIFPFD